MQGYQDTSRLEWDLCGLCACFSFQGISGNSLSEWLEGNRTGAKLSWAGADTLRNKRFDIGGSNKHHPRHLSSLC